MNHFIITAKDKDSSARCGVLQTTHGEIRTPVFMPVGTRATVKGLLPDRLEKTGSQIVLANTFHMMLRPGVETVEKLGGLHKLMAWNKPILTDSGGYQVFSLAKINRKGDDGVEFASPYDGKKVYLDPKIVTNVQNRLGADIIMCFDECPPFPCSQQELHKAVERTIRWAKICKESHANQNQHLFGIVQGGIDANLRAECTKELVKLDFPGYAIGGLSVGEGYENMKNTLDSTVSFMPENKPRYLMGVGTPADIIAAVAAGVDMFDCVMPTRNGRNALAFTWSGPIRLRNSAYIDDTSPIEADCDCYCCKNFTKAAIRHFFNVGEMLGPILLSLHNIAFYHNLMDKIKQNIDNGTFKSWAEQMSESPAFKVKSQPKENNDE
ncbi:MAG: tRNA guanosine(34) transglycosylase Tgt [Anaerohalosphaeraceae bacterium]|nr:tRNA guanosine(34) transglycosylase Tgt [Anaerohalosphaeraceae bacterium]